MTDRPPPGSHYDALGVPVGADADAVAAAFRAKALELHPDVDGGCEREREMEKG
jgi:curved DNA-binding protein CbpA